MDEQTNSFLVFGAYRIDVNNCLLFREGEVVALPPKAFDLLMVLVQSGGRVIPKDELMTRVWPDSFVEEANLSHHIFVLRRALGEDKNSSGCIKTIPRRGYRFVAEVTRPENKSDDLVVTERTHSRIVIEEHQEMNTAGSAVGSVESDQSKALKEGDRRTHKAVNLRVPSVVVALIVLGVAAYFWITGNRKEHPGPGMRSIAVLPFRPLVADSRNESLELGMADTLITKLSGIRQLIVRPISAVRKYAELEQDPIAAGRELGVDYVVEGNLQMIGEKTRATVRLLRVIDGSAIWTNTCDQQCSGLFELQDGVTERIAGMLALQLTGDERKQLAKHYTENVEAYQLYAKGRFLWNKFTDESLIKSIDYFQQAIGKDPNYALAYAGLSESYNVLGCNGPMPPKEALPKVKYAAEKAIELDDNLAQSHLAVGAFKLFYEWDWPGAERAFKRAMELDPRYAGPHELYGYLLRIMGRFDEALGEIRKAQALDPTSLLISGDSAETLRLARRYDEAIEENNKSLEMDPNFADAHYGRGLAYSLKGMHEKSVDEMKRAITLSGNNTQIIARLGQVYALAGRRSEAQEIIGRLISESRKRYSSPLEIAMIYAALGERDQAFTWLSKAYDENSTWLIELKVEPAWDNVRSDPRFESLLDRVGLPK
jgi:DNA-binding winged helix-turn-helix (wHTH) protein/TolB-like protein